MKAWDKVPETIDEYIAAFADELQGYATGKGTVQFLHTQPISMKLVETIVQYRVQTNLENAHLKKSRKVKDQ